MPISLDDYDRARASVAEAEAEAEEAKAIYDAAMAKLNAASHGLGMLRLQMNEMLSSVAAERAPRPERITPEPTPAAPLPLPVLMVAPAPTDAEALSTGVLPTTPEGVRPSLWELVLAIPLDGAASLTDLREELVLNDGAINARVTNAKKRGLIESAGWGRYQLTAEARGLRKISLRIVKND